MKTQAYQTKFGTKASIGAVEKWALRLAEEIEAVKSAGLDSQDEVEDVTVSTHKSGQGDSWDTTNGGPSHVEIEVNFREDTEWFTVYANGYESPAPLREIGEDILDACRCLVDATTY